MNEDIAPGQDVEWDIAMKVEPFDFRMTATMSLPDREVSDTELRLEEEGSGESSNLDVDCFTSFNVALPGLIRGSTDVTHVTLHEFLSLLSRVEWI